MGAQSANGRRLERNLLHLGECLHVSISEHLNPIRPLTDDEVGVRLHPPPQAEVFHCKRSYTIPLHPYMSDRASS